MHALVDGHCVVTVPGGPDGYEILLDTTDWDPGDRNVYHHFLSDLSYDCSLCFDSCRSSYTQITISSAPHFVPRLRFALSTLSCLAGLETPDFNSELAD